MITLLHGDAREVLATLPEKSVQCCVTSPPYYGLRAYGSDPREIGRETTPAAYVAALVDVFRAVWRVLMDDGVCWINLGDCYTQTSIRHRRHLYEPGYGGGGQGGFGAGHQSADELIDNTFSTVAAAGLPAKNLLGMPWRVAFALQDAGWVLRSDIIWSKPNPMPESVTDRPTRAHEYLFLFAKQQRYFYDATAIAEDSTTKDESWRATSRRTKQAKTDASRHDANRCESGTLATWQSATRNRRSVWTIATQPYAGAHFATMPEALIEPCILAGSASQACETCGAAWGRVTEKGDPIQQHWAPGTQEKIDIAQGKHGATSVMNTGYTRPNITTGFAPRCACATNTGAGRSIVLDPFGGSGTVARVAERFQRDSILIDLNAEYLELQAARTDGVQREFTL